MITSKEKCIYTVYYTMWKSINQSELPFEEQNLWKGIQKQQQENASNLTETLCVKKGDDQIRQNLQNIEQKRLKYVAKHKNDPTNYTVKAVETIKKLEPLPMSAIDPKPIPFAEGM